MRTSTHFHLAPPFGAPEWQSWIGQLPEIADSIDQRQMLHSGRNVVFWTERHDKRLAVKRFSNKGLWKKAVYRFNASKARRSYEHSLRLTEIGLQSPQPIAWREDWDGPWLRESFYVSECLPFDSTARDLKDAEPGDAERKAAMIGRAIGLMHERDILHLDMSQGNLLFAGDDGEPSTLYIIDNNRMRFGPVSPRRGIGTLLQVELEGKLLDQALNSYAETRSLDSQLCRQRYFARLRRYELKWQIKNTTRPWRRKVGL